MGQTSGRLLTQFMNSKTQKVIDFKSHIDAEKRSQEQWKTVKDLPQLIEKGYDPLHAIYIAAQNFTSLLSEELSNFPELKQFTKIVDRAYEEYMPQGPPVSPLTGSYFTIWAMFDVQFGVSKETIGTCILDLGKPFGIPSDMLDVIYLMQNSRMGIYEHCGFQGDYVVLRDLADDIEYTCYVGSKYRGQKGQLWFVRVFPPPRNIVNYHLVFTTPYILLSGKQSWIDFFNRAILKLKIKTPRSISEAIHDVMKRGLNVNYWNEFIFLSYANYQHDAIFLAGIPDEPESLPHHEKYRGGR